MCFANKPETIQYLNQLLKNFKQKNVGGQNLRDIMFFPTVLTEIQNYTISTDRRYHLSLDFNYRTN